MWKILMAQIKEEIYFSFISHELFPKEQKGCHKETRGTGELLYIGQHILNKRKMRWKNLTMAWIDDKKAYDMVWIDDKKAYDMIRIDDKKAYDMVWIDDKKAYDMVRIDDKKAYDMVWIDDKKAYDMVLKSWILHYLKIPDEVIKHIEKTMETWRVELTAGGKSLAEVKIQWGIFQGDALSPLLFVIVMIPLNNIPRKCTAGYTFSESQEKINHLMYMDDIKLLTKNEKELETLIQTNRIYSQDIGMEFGIEKCAMLAI